MITEEKLPKKFKDKWVKALRSGKYLQSSGGLLSGRGYCCLGVAAVVCGYTNEEIRVCGWLSPDFFPTTPQILQCDSDVENPLAKKLANFNDNGKSFKWIASYIERYL